MAKEVHSETEREQVLEILRNSYEMYERSKKETKDVRKNKTDKNGARVYTDKSIEDTIDLMETAQQDIKEKYLELGGKEEDLVSKKKKTDRKALLAAVETANQKDAMREYMKKMAEKSNEEATAANSQFTYKSVEVEDEDEDEDEPQVKKKEETPIIQPQPQTIQVKTAPNTAYNASMNKAVYDVVKLPSKGECYKSKIKEVMVSYLTAYDENMILSPNLYRNGTFLDHILKNKVLNDIDTDDLIQGDRDAIIIWLRASGYGNEYPINVTDNETGENFDTVADLSELNFKEFNLKGDSDGYFDFQLPTTGDIVKFKFLTAKDNKKLDKMHDEDSKVAKIATGKRLIRQLRETVEDNDLIDRSKYNLIQNALTTLETEILKKYEDLPEEEYSHDLTNRLILSTVSINGNKDREYIVNYLLNLNVKDSSAYRKYIIDNEPGIDYNIKVKRPDSLGGGYIDTFLQLDQFVFVSGV